MNDKLKLPLTAVFSFLLGGVVFFPWGANDLITTVNQASSTTNFIFDKIIDAKPVINIAEVGEHMTPTILVEYRFSEDELKVSNLAIDKQLKGSNSVIKPKIATKEKIELVSDDISKSVQTILVEYRFSKDELQVSNFAIKKQLRDFIPEENTEQDLLLSERLTSTNTTVFDNATKFKKVDYNFSSDEIKLSNLAIEKQLGRYIAINKHVEIKNNHNLNINDLEISEKSETELFVKDVADYSNDDENNTIESEDVTEEKIVQEESVEKYTSLLFSQAEIEKSNQAIIAQLRNYKEVEVSEKTESNNTKPLKILTLKRFVSVNFSKDKIALSQLAILKQLKGYIQNTDIEDDNDVKFQSSKSVGNDLDSIKNEQTATLSTQLNTVETDLPVKSEYEDETDLLISNSEHDDDDEEYSGILVKYQLKKPAGDDVLSSVEGNEVITEQELDDDDDDEEFSSERVVFSLEPRYFIDSFESESTANIEEDIDVPSVENINKDSKLDFNVEEVEVIEEIEINDDGKITTSSAEEY